MPGRGQSLDYYRFSFNGKEADTETGLQDYGFRVYDRSISRFLSVDPLAPDYPWYTPYQFAGNKPIWAVDLDGLEELFFQKKLNDNIYWQFVWGNIIEKSSYFKRFKTILEKQTAYDVYIFARYSLRALSNGDPEDYVKQDQFGFLIGDEALGSTWIVEDAKTGEKLENNPYIRLDYSDIETKIADGKKIIAVGVPEGILRIMSRNLNFPSPFKLTEGGEKEIVSNLDIPVLYTPSAAEKMGNLLLSVATTVIHEFWAHASPALSGNDQPAVEEHFKLFGERTKTSPSFLEAITNSKYKKTKLYEIITEMSRIINELELNSNK